MALRDRIHRRALTEGTESSQLDARLTEAQELIARGKQQRALDQLWEAEALARWSADAIRKMLRVASAFEQRLEPKQKPRLTYLLATLELDAKEAARAPVTAPPRPVDATPPSLQERLLSRPSTQTWFSAAWTILVLAIGILLEVSVAESEDAFNLNSAFEFFLAVLGLITWGTGRAVIWYVGWLIEMFQDRRRRDAAGRA
jgi:hypothetical protein